MVKQRAADARWRKLLCLIPGYDPFSDAGNCQFDAETASESIAFFHECLTHIEGELAGKPFLLSPWQQSIIANLFGWKRADGTRRYREAFLFVARKNGKTPLAAAIANYVMFCDDEKGQQNACAAAEREQAGLLFRHVKGMIENHPSMMKRAKIFKATGQRCVETDRATFRVWSADADTKHGGNPHVVIVDELHAQPNRELVDVIQTSFASANRRQPLLIFITTADFDRPSICNEKYDYACKVRDGIIKDAAFLPAIYEAIQGKDDWTDEAVWAKANPNLGVSVSLDYLRRECQRAKETPSYENTFKRLHLNMKTATDVRWLEMDRWDACDGAVNADELEGRPCFGGLDLATVRDIAAFVLVFPREDDGWVVLPRFFVPAEQARIRERRDRVPYETWIREGWIEATAGNCIDFDVIRKRVNEDAARFNIRKIGLDRWNSTQLATQLQQDGLELVFVGQGFKDMTAPSKELERCIAERVLVHGGNPVLRWMASNAQAETDAAGNLKPSKKRSRDKIDGIAAMCDALACALVDTGNAESVYETRGILTT